MTVIQPQPEIVWTTLEPTTTVIAFQPAMLFVLTEPSLMEPTLPLPLLQASFGRVRRLVPLRRSYAVLAPPSARGMPLPVTAATFRFA